MRGVRRLVLSVITVTALSAAIPSSGFAQSRSSAPDDVPWDEIDRVLKETPRPSDASDDAITPPDNLPGRSDTDGSEAALPADPGNDRLSTPALAGSPVRPGMPPQSAVVKTAAATARADTVPFDDPGDGEVAAPSAVPSETPPPGTAPVATPAPAVIAVYDPAKFYLPTKEFFAGKAAVTLANYDRADRDHLSAFYETRLGEPLWVSKSGFNGAADNLIAELKRANDWGLEASAYQIPALARIGTGDFSADDLTDAEVKLSLAAMAYARHARGDRIPDPTTQLSSYIDRKPNLIDRRVFLDRLAAAPDKSAYLRSTHPQHPQFELLRQKLIALRAEPEQKPAARIARGSSVKPGKSHPHVALVRARLKVASPGMKPDGTAADDTYYDQALAQAVIRFKEQNALGATPVIDNALRNTLNAPNEISPSLLLTNMEQWRWMPNDLGATHVMVNIPEFMVRVIKNGSVLHAERVVTGQVSTQTPIFSDVMRTVVFQPSWNVPESIKVNELLPRLRAGGNPIAGRGLEIKRNGRSVDPWDIDWFNRDIRNYDIYQPPGPGNVLGVVKFMFPNKHSVYLHDTPSKSLFNEASRTFSHGCVRVRNPVRLAEVLMAEDKNWDRERVKDVLDSGPENNDVALDRPVPIHITYFTAWVTDTGDVRRFADVYGHEQRIKLGLAGRFDDIDKNRDHLLPTEIPVASARPRNRDFYYVDEYGNYRQARANSGQGYYYTYGGRPPKQLQKKKPSLGNFFKQVFGAN
ncbi:MAG: L,D-transpeptidase family protein [Hyphomicrobium sp.]|nr:L,D-transpeptidase family protein [Hyphomicrobium sp.]